MLAAWQEADAETFRIALRHPSAPQVIEDMGEAVKAYIPSLMAPLITFMSDSDGKIRETAAQVIGVLARVAHEPFIAHESFPQFAELMDDENPKIRLNAMRAVRYMGKAGKVLASEVTKRLWDSDRSVVSRAISMLSEMGTEAREQVPVLVEALLDKRAFHLESIQKHELMKILVGFGEEAIAPHAPRLIQGLMNQDYFVIRPYHLQLFGHMGAATRDISLELHALLDHPKPVVRGSVAIALGFMGSVAQKSLSQLLTLMESSDQDVREAAAIAVVMIRFPEWAEQVKALNLKSGFPLGFYLAEQLKPSDVAPDLAALFQDADKWVRQYAFWAVQKMGENGRQYTPQLAVILSDPEASNWNRLVAAETLVNLGAQDYIPKLEAFFTARLNDPETSDSDRTRFAKILGKLGVATQLQATLLVDIWLSLEKLRGHKAVPDVLNKMGALAIHHAVSYIIDLLSNSNQDMMQKHLKAALLLSSLKSVSEQQLSQIVDLFNAPDKFIQSKAAVAVSAIGAAAEPYIDNIKALLHGVDEEVKEMAARTLVFIRFPELFQPYFGASTDDKIFAEEVYYIVEAMKAAVIRTGQPPTITERLGRERTGSWVIARVLGMRGHAARPYAQPLAAWLTDPDQATREATATSLEALGPLDIGGILSILNESYRDASRRPELRFLAHLLGGGQPHAETLITWLAQPLAQPSTSLSRPHRRAILDVFDTAWPLSETLPEVRQALRSQIAHVIQAGAWAPHDLERLNQHAHHVAGTPEEVAIRAVITAMQRTRWTLSTALLGLGHLTCWIALIVAYPKSPMIQALFFWNPWVRRFAGLGYVGLALTWVPYLRSRLFAPFRQVLLADAELEHFDRQAYFADSTVADGDGGMWPITEAISEIKGQLVLEGESGLGKTMFVRYVVQRTRRVVVYLPARKCAHGVVEAIQDKLEGPARDPAFLHTLIYIGALDVCIDGLNEVDAETRARISNFAERNFKGNILMATQPLGWRPPSTSTVYVMQPLSPEAIEAFLLTQTEALSPEVTLSGSAYVSACRHYVDRVLDRDQSQETRDAVLQVLSNPMDLTIVSQMISEGEMPDLFHLREQQYRQMALAYERVYLGQWFPLESFSEAVYQMRLTRETALPSEAFLKELEVMEGCKMVVSRQHQDDHGGVLRAWYFRHDKIMDYFIVQTFLGEGNERPVEHLGDSRFRGVYLLLALLMPVAAAAMLREQLIDYAADTKDHTVSDRFIRLLSSRKAA